MENEKQLVIEVRDKIATLKSKNFNLVCWNNDYDVVFDFDDDWSNYTTKTAVFVFGKENPVYKVFNGNICEGVEIKNSTMCLIGVFAGNIATTTPACVECIYRSILDESNGTPEPPEENVYNQIIELINRYINAVKGAPSGGLKGQVLKKKSDADYDYNWENDEKADLSQYPTNEELEQYLLLKADRDKIIREYDPKTEYLEGDIVSHKGILYRKNDFYGGESPDLDYQTSWDRVDNYASLEDINEIDAKISDTSSRLDVEVTRLENSIEAIYSMMEGAEEELQMINEGGVE